MTGSGAQARRLHPLAMVGTSIKSLPSAAAGMIGSVSLLGRDNPALAVAAGGVILLLIAGGAVIGWWRFTYRIDAREIVIERGLLNRQRRVIPFTRIIDVAIERPLLARLLGTARVRIETGGAEADEGKLDMIGLQEASALRDLVRAAGVAEETGEERVDAPEAAEEPVFAMATPRVLGLGLLNFSLVFIALLFGALQYLDDLRIFDFQRWIRSGEAEAIVGMVGGQAAILLAILLLALGVVSGLARTLAREHDFRLTASAAGLRRRRGLLTLSEALIPARRTEAALIDTSLVSGSLGWQSLAFQTLGAGKSEGGVQVAAPLARPAEIDRILAKAGFPLPARGEMRRPPARALIRRCGPALLVATLAAAVGIFWVHAWWAAAACALIAVAGFVHWRRERFLIGEQALYVAGGILRRRLWILPFGKLQTLSTSRTPLQRWLGLASLAPDLAGAPLLGGPEIDDLEAQEAEALADRLLGLFYGARAELRRQGAINS